MFSGSLTLECEPAKQKEKSENKRKIKISNKDWNMIVVFAALSLIGDTITFK